MKHPLEDITKTLIPNSVVLGMVHAADLKTDLEIALLFLSIAYTAIRLGMLLSRKHRNDPEPDTGEADSPDYLSGPED